MLPERNNSSEFPNKDDAEEHLLLEGLSGCFRNDQA